MKPKRVQRSFAFFYKERKKMQRTPRSFIKNAKNAALFYKERKRMQRTPHSFKKNVKECKEHRILL